VSNDYYFLIIRYEETSIIVFVSQGCLALHTGFIVVVVVMLQLLAEPVWISVLKPPKYRQMLHAQAA
jgi:hypothetical protein